MTNSTQAAQVEPSTRALVVKQARYSADSMLLTEQLAKEIHQSPRTLENWRRSGDGPPFSRVGKRALYRWSDVVSWFSNRSVSSTSEERAA